MNDLFAVGLLGKADREAGRFQMNRSSTGGQMQWAGVAGGDVPEAPLATSRSPYISVANCSVAVSKGKSRFSRSATSAGPRDVEPIREVSALRMRIDDDRTGATADG